jgi:transposase
MKKNVMIGIDFSKLTLDVTCFNVKGQSLKHYQQFENTEDGCLALIKWAKSMFEDVSDWLVCGEFTGIYSMTAAMVFNANGVGLWLENPSQIKLSSGVSREKNDKVDSCQIALYASRFMDRAKLYKPGNGVLLKIRELVRFKDRLSKVRSQLTVPANELKRVRKDWEESSFIDASSQGLASSIDVEIKKIEKQMLVLLKTDPDLKRLYELINSVVGVGMQTAAYLLVHTWGFTAFGTPRQLACYCGVVPFAKQSGTSISGKRRVSHIANKKLKTLLHMCALNAVRYDPVLKEYYERKIKEGKHRMNILNNVRNKLLHRICAVVKSGKKYDTQHHLRCADIAA